MLGPLGSCREGQAVIFTLFTRWVRSGSEVADSREVATCMGEENHAVENT
jgi:hypothetical protein